VLLAIFADRRVAEEFRRVELPPVPPTGRSATLDGDVKYLHAKVGRYIKELKEIRESLDRYQEPSGPNWLPGAGRIEIRNDEAREAKQIASTQGVYAATRRSPGALVPRTCPNCNARSTAVLLPGAGER
jgi:hypothetical protein